MKISIIVPAFNEEKLLRGTLQAIQHASKTAFQPLGWDYEHIVCDNNSTDQTAAIAREEGALVVHEPINQISRARNAGAAAATGDWLVFIDGDSWPSPELFADLAAAIQNPKIVGGGCLVNLEETGLLTALLLGAWNLLSRVVRWAAGSFIFCQARAFRAIGGFSQELFAAEEIDFSKRLKALARRERKRFVILRKHRLLTSARKARFLTRSDHGRFWRRAILRPRTTLRDREACFPWYDGRR